jgi:large subunit ribosomal protein L28
MAKCEKCGRGAQFGNTRPWSKKATRRRWNVNVQKVNVMAAGRPMTQRLCSTCIKTLTKV